MLKGNKTILLLGVLVLLVAIYGIVKLTSGEGRSKSYKDVLVDLDTARVTKVEISSASGDLVLDKVDGQWMVKGDKKALNTSVQTMLATLNGIKPSRIAARSEDKWPDFQVDTSGTNIKVSEEGGEELDLIIGRFGVEGQRNYFTYVRLADDEDTYVANNFMGMSIGKTDADYRNNRVLKLEQDSVVAVEFVEEGKTMILEKTADQWLLGGTPADGVKVKDYLKKVSYLTSRNFNDDSQQPDGRKITFHLTNGSIEMTSYGDGLLGSSTNEEVFSDAGLYEKVFVAPESLLN